MPCRRGSSWRSARSSWPASAYWSRGCRRTVRPTTTTTARWSDQRASHRPGQVCRADDAGFVAQRGDGDRGDRAMAPGGQLVLETLARRPEEQLAGVRHAAADDDERRVDDRRDRRRALADPATQGREQLESERVALPGGLRHLWSLQVVGVATGKL